MDFTEFDRLVERLRQCSAAMQELLDTEQHLGVTLLPRYKTFMIRYGGGQFGLLDRLPVTPPPAART